MTRSARVWALFTLLLTLSSIAGAQLPPPPGPAEPLPPPPPAAPPASAPAPASGVNPDIDQGSAAQGAPTDDSSAPQEEEAAIPGDEPPPAASAGDPDAISEEEFAELERQQEERQWRLKDQMSLRGSTGLMHTQYAGSGPVGTFRFAVLGSYLSTEEFLCPQCSDPAGGPGSTPDEVSRVGAHVQLSATPLEFLEAYFGVHSTATSNTRGDPQLLQVLGDTTWGVKAFMPRVPNRAFSAGGALELWMLNGTGGVGIDGASFAMRGLTTFDFTNYEKPEDRVPLRINVGLSYVFDNSGALVRDIEDQRNRAITRIERYGLNINRLDRIVPALGVEGMFDAVRPYLEWSIDVPSNRQDYTCLQNDVHASDSCLSDTPSFTGTPSRFTLGTRVYALLDGLGFHAALDIGTGGMKPPFWEEVQPESPWNLYFGVAYTADTQPRVERVKVAAPVVEAPPPPKPPTRYVIEGVVSEKGSQAAVVANAVVRYQGQPLTGMVTNEQGAFRTVYLEPGTYTLDITADGYKDGSCSITIEPNAGGTPEGAQPEMGVGADGGAQLDMSGGAVVAEARAGDAAQAEDVRAVQARCELEPKPKLGTLVISVVDAKEGTPIAGASIVVSKDGRSITLSAEEQGEVEVVDVPSGPVSLRITAEGYYPTNRAVDVVPETRTTSPVRLFPVGRANFAVGSDVIKQRKDSSIEFEPGTSKLTPESSGLIDELAVLLKDKPELSLEIQSHTDDSLPFQEALTLSTERASTIRERLVANGVEPGRVSAKGMGASKPAVPNTSDANKARNNRVELVIRGK